MEIPALLSSVVGQDTILPAERTGRQEGWRFVRRRDRPGSLGAHGRQFQVGVFTMMDGDVYMTYSTTARGLEVVMTYYGILDRVPAGRNEGAPPDPSWMRRHDEFGMPGRADPAS